jgi:hypothetical protein
MFCTIVSKYERFADSLISAVTYNSTSTTSIVEVLMECWSNEDDYKREKIKLKFIDIQLFRFIEVGGSTVINSALLKNEDNLITVDFFPIRFERELLEDTNSDFLIKCKKITYEVLPAGA